MKAYEPNRTPSEEELLDRLVDDELDDAQRRELLTALEQKPDGWRRCALAFLEAQCWRRELRHLASAKVEKAAQAAGDRPSPAPPPAPPPAPQRSHGWGATVLAMAASFLLALGLSYEMRFGGSSDSGSVPSAGDLTRADSSASAGLHSRGEDPWRMVTLSGSDLSGNPQSVELPAREKQQLDPSWWQGAPVPMPPEMLQALKNSGHEVEQSRQLMPVPLRDGRKLVVPVDQVDVHYVGNPEYQ